MAKVRTLSNQVEVTRLKGLDIVDTAVANKMKLAKKRVQIEG